jgi:hemerythrin-like metal-binding protein
MKKYRINQATSHLKEHDYFIEKVMEYCYEFKNGNHILDNMKEWILIWWISHINLIDKKSFEYANWVDQVIDQAEDIEDVKIILRKTGIEEIDNDHLVLMNMTLMLHNLIKTSSENSDINFPKQFIELYDEIYSYATKHFKYEEKIMNENKIEGFENHCEEHVQILRKLEDIKKNYISKRLKLSSNIKTMILHWWLQHTNTTDYRTFVYNYLSEKNVIHNN